MVNKMGNRKMEKSRINTLKMVIYIKINEFILKKW